ncbi:VanW family protein [Paraconexibacter sp. AEG42_29]|uniref:VanW family protein n=1 Tax=Paraconexibacter sp. AEG42_29 TaxID=2997339 RepID=UPI00339D4A8C
MLLAPILLVALSVVMLRIVYTDRALPGTHLAGVNVEGDSSASLKERMTRLKASPVTVYAAGKQLRITPVDAGYEQDVEATVDRVLDAGRDGPLFGLVKSARGVFESREVAPADRVDAAKIDATSRRVARLINRETFPGAIDIDPSTYEVNVQGPRKGRTVNRPALKGQLVEALRSGKEEFRVPFDPRPVAKVSAVRKVADDARAFLQQDLVITGAGEPIVWGKETLASFLRLRSSTKDRSKVRLGSDEPRLIELVAGIAKARDRPPREPSFAAPSKLATLDGKGAVTWRSRAARVSVTRAGFSGRTIDREEAVIAIADAVRTGRHTAKLPVKLAKPKVTQKAAEKVDSLIGTFTTRYESGQPRVTNIRRMARTVDGTVIAPGAQFDLNAVVGERTSAKGYVKAPFIGDGNKIVPSIGGGVSQFSTTMYNAAYFAGLRVDTHQPHSLYISRYPPGREATLDFPSIDLKWTNDTDVPVVVRTFTDSRSVTVSLYGDNGGRTVTAKPGPRQPLAGGDFEIKVTRTVKYGDGRTADDSFTSKYAKGDE